MVRSEADVRIAKTLQIAQIDELVRLSRRQQRNRAKPPVPSSTVLAPGSSNKLGRV